MHASFVLLPQHRIWIQKNEKKNKIVRRTLPTFLLDMIPIFCLLFYFPSLLNRIVEKKQKKLIPLIHIRFWYWKGIEKKDNSAACITEQ